MILSGSLGSGHHVNSGTVADSLGSHGFERSSVDRWPFDQNREWKRMTRVPVAPARRSRATSSSSKRLAPHRMLAHPFMVVCVLVAYLLCHVRKPLAPLCLADKEIPARADPIAPATRTQRGKSKDATKVDTAGETLHDLLSVVNHLATVTRNTVAFADGVRIDKLALPTALRRRTLAGQAVQGCGAALESRGTARRP